MKKGNHSPLKLSVHLSSLGAQSEWQGIAISILRSGVIKRSHGFRSIKNQDIKDLMH
jgi:hypothetical protein